ncbi:unnamed protein product [Pleuronectes platessa]|uniref:Uncharacterized protein n=1 Tax=Pleuronectes platessa TaxID=8262 RepID=A0A9N7U6M0_PLEPL|nr:unnamed protein product [Pleuronectes platessa]
MSPSDPASRPVTRPKRGDDKGLIREPIRLPPDSDMLIKKQYVEARLRAVVKTPPTPPVMDVQASERRPRQTPASVPVIIVEVRIILSQSEAEEGGRGGSRCQSQEI